ncbi:MAG: hypothetical protein HOE36_07530 [Flavobacteriaceae bacterium]|nr:hypothetical protein [Flavobacteriaceae bacterium]
MGQKVLGIGIVAITGLALTGQGKNLKSKKKKLPTGGKADYMKSLGGGGGGGGGGSRGSSSPPKKTSPKPNDSTVTAPEETSSITDTGSSDSGLDWSIQQTIANNEATQTADSSLLDLLNYGVPEEQQISTQAYDWDWDIGGILQQNIADGTAFSWLNEDSIQDPTSVSVTNNVDGWLQQYTNDEEIELEETDTGSSDSGLDWSIQQTIANNEAAQEDSTPATYTLSPSSSGVGYSL